MDQKTFQTESSGTQTDIRFLDYENAASRCKTLEALLSSCTQKVASQSQKIETQQYTLNQMSAECERLYVSIRDYEMQIENLKFANSEAQNTMSRMAIEYNAKQAELL